MIKSNYNILPNLIIAGVNKAGTTSLFTYLALHPDICASSVKETCYFLPLRYGHEMLPITEYSKYFKHCKIKRYIMESTPGYFYGGKHIANAIKKQLGNVKIILLFRNPIDRLISFFKFKKTMMELDQNISIEEYIDACESISPDERGRHENNIFWGIEGGFYAKYLQGWFDVFEESVKIIFFDQLRDNSIQLLRELSEWLMIDHNPFYSASLNVENPSFNYNNKHLQRIALSVYNMGEKFWQNYPSIKHLLRCIYYKTNGKPFEEKIPNTIIKYLQSIYKPYNQRLALQLSRRGYKNLPSWLNEVI
jgi:hypothetical protein